MHILTISGSLRADSYNTQLARAAGQLLAKMKPSIECSLLEWSDIPLMNEDIEHPTPASIARIRQAVAKADGLWVFSPEYNHAIPGPLKNLFDWLSRPQDGSKASVLSKKPLALAGASIGSGGATHAQEQLVNLLSLLNANLMNTPRLSIANIASRAPEGTLTLSTSLPYLEKQADAFVRFIAKANPSLI